MNSNGSGVHPTNDQVWADAASSYYENESLPDEYGEGQRPVTKFGLTFGAKILRLRIAPRPCKFAGRLVNVCLVFSFGNEAFLLQNLRECLLRHGQRAEPAHALP